MLFFFFMFNLLFMLMEGVFVFLKFMVIVFGVNNCLVKWLFKEWNFEEFFYEEMLELSILDNKLFGVFMVCFLLGNMFILGLFMNYWWVRLDFILEELLFVMLLLFNFLGFFFI